MSELRPALRVEPTQPVASKWILVETPPEDAAQSTQAGRPWPNGRTNHRPFSSCRIAQAYPTRKPLGSRGPPLCQAYKRPDPGRTRPYRALSKGPRLMAIRSTTNGCPGQPSAPSEKKRSTPCTAFYNIGYRSKPKGRLPQPRKDKDPQVTRRTPPSVCTPQSRALPRPMPGEAGCTRGP